LGITSTVVLSLLLSTGSVSFIHGIDPVLIVVGLKVVERLENSVLAHKDPAVNEVWQSLGDLITHVGSGWDSKDVVKFFEGALFCLRDPEKDHDESNDVGAGVEAEDTLERIRNI
jgi:hypothetical protein